MYNFDARHHGNTVLTYGVSVRYAVPASCSPDLIEDEKAAGGKASKKGGKGGGKGKGSSKKVAVTKSKSNGKQQEDTVANGGSSNGKGNGKGKGRSKGTCMCASFERRLIRERVVMG